MPLESPIHPTRFHHDEMRADFFSSISFADFFPAKESVGPTPAAHSFQSVCARGAYATK